MLSVCVLNPSSELGGAERSLLDLLRRLSGKDMRYMRFTVLLPRNGPLEGKLRELDVDSLIVPMPASILGLSRKNLAGSAAGAFLSAPAFIAYLAGLIWTVRRLKCSVIYTNGIKSHITGALISRFCGCRLVWHVRDIVKEGLFLRLLRLASTRADRIIFNSNFTARSFKNILSATDKMIYNGFDLSYFAGYGGDPGEFRKKYGISGDALLCGTLGVLTRGKGLEVLVAAAPLLINEHKNIRFIIAGDDIYDTPEGEGCRARLEALVEDKGLSPYFVFTGFLEDIRPCLASLDIFVMPSVAVESFGRSAVEAMLSKKPVVASGIGALPELIEDGVTGFLVKPSSPDELASAIDKLLRDKELRDNIATLGFHRALDSFPVDKYAFSVEKVLSGAGSS